MSSNTKYQPAPQRDSFEEPNYTQAPPSYQAEASGHHDILGGPRSEDDNVPDDFKVGRSSSMLQHSLTVREEMANSKYSLAAPSRRRHCLSGCSLFARSIPSCKSLLSAFFKPTALHLTSTGLSRLLRPSRSVPCHTSAQATRPGSSQMHG